MQLACAVCFICPAATAHRAPVHCQSGTDAAGCHAVLRNAGCVGTLRIVGTNTASEAAAEGGMRGMGRPAEAAWAMNLDATLKARWVASVQKLSSCIACATGAAAHHLR